jgi:hypothetical protein
MQFLWAGCHSSILTMNCCYFAVFNEIFMGDMGRGIPGLHEG